MSIFLFPRRTVSYLYVYFRYFAELSEKDFARSGAEAAETITLDAGPVAHSFSMTEQLRKLGMPVMLKTGVVELLENYTICRKGQTLTPDQAKLLVSEIQFLFLFHIHPFLFHIQKHFDIKMSEFKIELVSMWSTGTGYRRLMEE